MKPATFLQKYFWEIDFNNLDLDKRTEYITLRILEYGDIRAVRWLFKNVSKEKIKEVIIKRRGLSQKSLYFWSYFFNINSKDLLCLKRSCPKKQKNHWPY